MLKNSRRHLRTTEAVAMVCLAWAIGVGSAHACDRAYPFRAQIASHTSHAFLDFAVLSELLGVLPNEITLEREDCVPQEIRLPDGNNLNCQMQYASAAGDSLHLFQASFGPSEAVLADAVEMSIDDIGIFMVAGTEDGVDRVYAQTAPNDGWYSLNYMPPPGTAPEARLQILRILPFFASSVFVCQE